MSTLGTSRSAQSRVRSRERRKNVQQEKMVDGAEQMQTIQDMALKKITMLEKKLAEAQAEE